MFVSSYNTYINTNTNSKNIKADHNTKEDSSKSFTQKLSSSLSAQPLNTTISPANYISQAQVQYNKQLLESKQEYLKNDEEKKFTQTKELSNKFSTISTLGKAKIAYSENSVMFSFLRKPHTSLDQTPKIDQEMPQELQELKEKKIRDIMVNTYLENDRYYQITA